MEEVTHLSNSISDKLRNITLIKRLFENTLNTWCLLMREKGEAKDNKIKRKNEKSREWNLKIAVNEELVHCEHRLLLLLLGWPLTSLFEWKGYLLLLLVLLLLSLLLLLFGWPMTTMNDICAAATAAAAAVVVFVIVVRVTNDRCACVWLSTYCLC